MVVENVGIPTFNGFVDEGAADVKVNWDDRHFVDQYFFGFLKECEAGGLVLLGSGLANQVVKFGVAQLLWLLPLSLVTRLRKVLGST